MTMKFLNCYSWKTEYVSTTFLLMIRVDQVVEYFPAICVHEAGRDFFVARFVRLSARETMAEDSVRGLKISVRVSKGPAPS